MMYPSRPELAAWILGATDPDRTDEIAELVQSDPRLARRVALLRERLPAWRAAAPSAWHMPPPGVRRPGAPWVDAHAAFIMSGEPMPPGGRFEILLRDPPASLDAVVIVLRQRTEGWEVLFPQHPEDRLVLADLEQKDGGRVLQLSAGPETGAQRWGVAIVDAGMVVDWALPAQERWEPLKSAIYAGIAPVVTLDIHVGATR